MYQRTEHHETLIEYLRDHTYKTVPEHLWNQHLWIYKDLIKKLNIPFLHPADRPNFMEFYTLTTFDEITGLVMVRHLEDGLYIDISSNSTMGVLPLLNKYKHEGESIKVTTDNEEIAKFIASEMNASIELGHCYYYFNHQSIHHYHTRAREITIADTKKYESIKYMDTVISLLRYYGYFSDDDVISTVGIAPLSPFHAEVIGLNTYKETHRRKGYGKAVAQVAIAKALEKYAVITWTTQITNIASHRTAVKLGFQPYLSKFHVEIK